jgi:SAM-dependent methyltransferase
MEAMSPQKRNKKLLQDLGSSLRRHLIDEFHFRYVPTLPAGSLVLDLGGNRIGKRGVFDIDRYDFRVIYANLSRVKQPNLQTEASCLPFREAVFDVVVCSELLEHVPCPPVVLSEIFRILRKGGTLLICVPFLTRIHGDPSDYGRYTDYYWSETLRSAGFTELQIEKQGGFWCVLTDMLRELAVQKRNSGFLSWPWPATFLERMVSLAKSKALAWDSRSDDRDKSPYDGFTTGFGIKAMKE